MASKNELYVPILRFMRKHGTVTRTEMAKIFGKTRNVIAGICDKHYIVPWPTVTKKKRHERMCQFPTVDARKEEISLCGCPPDIGHTYLCKTHRKMTWPPPPPAKETMEDPV